MRDPARLEFLDALRAVAIIGVVVVHTGIAGALPAPGASLAHAGARGVQLFFVISGFLMMHTWHEGPDQAQGKTLRFWMRRFFRIAPLYYIAMIGTLLIFRGAPGYWAPEGVGTGDVLANMLFVHALIPSAMTSVVGGGWSISCEMIFYAIVPLIAAAVRGPWSAVILFAVSAASSSWLGSLALEAAGPGVGGYLNTQWVMLWPPAQFPAFAAGVGAWFAWRRIRGRDAPLLLGAGLLTAGVGGLVFLVSGGADLRQVSAFAVAFALVLLGLATCPTRLVVNPAMRFIGRMSYSMYVVHFFVLYALTEFNQGVLRGFGKVPDALGPADGTAYVAVVIAATIALSWALHHAIERPAIALGRTLTAILETRRPALRLKLSMPRGAPGKATELDGESGW